MTVKSLTEDIRVRTLIRELHLWQDNIASIEHEMRDQWPKKTLSPYSLNSRYKTMDMLTGMLSKAHANRHRLQKEIHNGR